VLEGAEALLDQRDLGGNGKVVGFARRLQEVSPAQGVADALALLTVAVPRDGTGTCFAKKTLLTSWPD
jgi:hypothetical protein